MLLVNNVRIIKPVSLTTSSPTISVPVMHRYLGPPVEFFDGQVQAPTDWVPGDPEVFPLNTLKFDEDGEPVKEALFANHNAEMRLNVDGHSLVGRSEDDRGVAHKIDVIAPLKLEERQLWIDTTGLGSGGGTGTGGGIPEAPSDDIARGRRNAAWTPVLMSSNDVVDGGNF